MRIETFIFDTNTLVSALLIPTSISRSALQKADDTGTLVFSAETIYELREVLTRTKFDKYLPLERRMEFVERWESRGEILKTTSSFNVCRDPKDNKFLNLAFDSKCSVLVTGDKDLLVLNPFERIPILTSSQFLTLI